MRGYSIKEFVGDVSLEWMYDVDTDKMYLTERVGNLSTEPVEIDSCGDDLIAQAFNLLLKHEQQEI